ncbi:MAG: hypothetical protein CL764_06240 [Chloroflexi bacterium]|nr:hypothetical protein [Chloroflexota bacterium]|tara:strand:- start:3349 stop:4374 length:1026 start_codon:yes stop_codon:yes gene_type:complete
MVELKIDLNEFEKFINEFVNRDIELYTIIKYQLGICDEYGQDLNESVIKERNFAILTLMVNKILMNDSQKSIPLASGIELLGNSWYVHGDVQSGITHRNHKPSVWWIWGPAQAINAGDGFHALARLVIVDNSENYGDEKILIALNRFDLAFLDLSEGESLDISFQDKPIVTIEEYMKMVKKRSGSLTGCAFEFGLLGSDLPESMNDEQIKIFNQIGSNYGVFSQLRDDWKTIFESETPSPQLFHRFTSKKKNIPVLYGLEFESATIKRQIGEIYLKRVLEEEDRKQIAKLILNTDFQNYYKNLIQEIKKELFFDVDRSFLSYNQKTLLKSFFEKQYFDLEI